MGFESTFRTLNIDDEVATTTQMAIRRRTGTRAVAERPVDARCGRKVYGKGAHGGCERKAYVEGVHGRCGRKAHVKGVHIRCGRKVYAEGVHGRCRRKVYMRKAYT